jgi:Fe-Mn family superoxide dismutase
MPMNRREMLQQAGLGAATLVLSPLSALAQDKPGFTLPKLPYAFGALEPHIDKQTMEIHHDRHHQAYVDNLNKALAAHPELYKKPIDAILRDIQKVPKDIQPAVINNGGGHFNHSLFWEIMGPKGGGKPGGALGKAIDDAFGNFAKFQDQMTLAGMTRFGSGWAWLVVEKGKPLSVRNSLNQDCPLMDGVTPILGLDVWEHAYYLLYQNKRADYIKAWWNVVNWDAVAQRFANAPKG